MKMDLSQASGFALLAALLNLVLGLVSLWFGIDGNAISLWGFGTACLLQIPPALSLRGRIQDGLGNSGLERERLTLKTVSFLLQLLALGLAMASISALLGDRTPQSSPLSLSLALLALVLQAALWFAKRGLAGVHPALGLDASRTRTMLELATLLLVGNLLGRWFPGADAITGLALALRLLYEGRTLAKGTTLPAAACGGCGGGCG
jgi:hypothetical protein